MTIELYCFGESGNAYKAALALELSGMDWTPVYVDFFNGETRGEAFREINPMGEVPVLRDGDVTLTQSGVMQMYVTEKTGRFGDARGGARGDALDVLGQSQDVEPGRDDTVPDEFPARGEAPRGGDPLHAGASEIRLCHA